MQRMCVSWCAAGAGVVLASSGVAWGGPATFENTVNTFGVIKTGHFVQVDAATVGTQSFDFFAGFTEENPADHNVQLADFKYTNQDAIPNSVGMLEGSPGAWQWADPTMYGNQAAMDYFYTSANDYIFRLHVDGMGAFEESIDGPSDLYPDAVPRVNNYNALQAGVDPTMDVPVTFDGFGSVGGLNQVVVRVVPTGGLVQAWSGSVANTETALSIPGGVLDPSTSYDLYVRYRTFQNYNDRTSVFPDALAAFTFRYETKVTFTTGLPSPGAAAALGVWGCAASRRRRRQ